MRNEQNERERAKLTSMEKNEHRTQRTMRENNVKIHLLLYCSGGGGFTNLFLFCIFAFVRQLCFFSCGSLGSDVFEFQFFSFSLNATFSRIHAKPSSDVDCFLVVRSCHRANTFFVFISSSSSSSQSLFYIF